MLWQQSNETGVADRATNRLVDRLVDIALGSLSANLYRARNVQVTAILEDMVDFLRTETLQDYNISNKIQRTPVRGKRIRDDTRMP